MPLYEYACRACGHRFEQLVQAAEADRATCPSCGAGAPKRLLSVIAGVSGAAEPPPPVCGAGACGNC